jgi:hypothetical protein
MKGYNMTELVIEQGKKYYCAKLGKDVLFVRWDYTGLAVVVDESDGEQYLVYREDLVKAAQ